VDSGSKMDVVGTEESKVKNSRYFSKYPGKIKNKIKRRKNGNFYAKPVFDQN